ncbi:hypothetical protein [Nocardioides caldifontis]|uniref:hypothetical protein n=1 Tax=Nocardioides caldifontis TaxID=2588938 RepID=UPI0011DF3D43|nr:hypothetical protein [Nocardioides caldifontis]
MRFPTRQWFRTTKGALPVVLSLLLVLALLALFLVAQASGEDADSAPLVEDELQLVVWPTDARGFVKGFKAGRYGRFERDFRYSRSFKRMYLRKAEASWARQRRSASASGKPAMPTDGQGRFDPEVAWQLFTARDTCASNTSHLSSVADCTAIEASRKLLRSDYWQRRSDAFNRWTARVVWCGGVGLITFYSGGTAASAIGPGSSGCLGSFLVK